MKRLVVCCDGTWQHLSCPYPTNVVKLVQAVKPTADDGTPQILHYDQGIGTAGLLVERLTAGAFGWGIDDAIQSVYRFLCLNYDHGAGDEIYLFGFSRGAYTVRSLGGLISRASLLRRDNIRKAPEAYELYRRRDEDGKGVDPHKPEAQTFRANNSEGVDGLDNRVPIHFLGCWDTVGELGVPDLIPWLTIDEFFNAKYRFHDTNLSSIIRHARHGVAVDENRKTFNVTPMLKAKSAPEQDLSQVWFPGGHGCVGGGTKEQAALSNAALLWMAKEAAAVGLEFDLNRVEGGFPCVDHKIPFAKEDSFVDALIGNHYVRQIEEAFDAGIHESTKNRWRDMSDYRPFNLKSRFEHEFLDWTALHLGDGH